MKVSVVIVAAGRGKRFGSKKNKVLWPLGGRPVLEWSLRAYASVPSVREIIVVCSNSDRRAVSHIAKRFSKVSQVVLGGKERFDSVWEGLQRVDVTSDVVLIHDAARPLISKRLIQETVRQSAKVGGAIVAIPVADTIKRSMDGRKVRETVARETLWRAQTPQGFRRARFVKAYESARRARVLTPDDAAIAERFGIPVAIVPGEEANLKITRRADLRLVELFQSTRR